MKERKPLIAGNWKMYKTCKEAEKTAGRLVALVDDIIEVDIMIAPVFTALSTVFKIVENTNISLGAQNLFWEKEGAFTGEISAEMIKSIGCSHRKEGSISRNR